MVKSEGDTEIPSISSLPPKADSSTRIILVRHCQTLWNINGLFQGHADSPVTEEGQEQLRILSEKMKQIPFDIIYSSPLGRTVATAEAVRGSNDTEIILDDGLQEIDVGALEGKTWDYFSARYPEQAELWYSAPERFSPDGGERMDEVYCRAKDTILRIASDNPGKSICIVSHGCVIRTFICFAIGLPLDKLREVGWCPNTGISIIDIDSKMQPEIIINACIDKTII